MVHSSTGARFIDLGIARSPEGTTHALRAYVPQVGGPGPRPLLVMFDGQNIFEDHGSYSGGWHAHEAVEKLGAATTRAPTTPDAPAAAKRPRSGPPRSGADLDRRFN